MRPVKIIQRRSQTLPKRRLMAGLYASLRCTSLLVVVVALCEVSGLSQAVVSALSDEKGSVGSNVTVNIDSFARDTKEEVKVEKLPLYTELDSEMTMKELMEKISAESIRNKKQEEGQDYELELYWTVENFGDKVCRIHNACMEKEGVVVVPEWMKKRESLLRECGVRQIKYMKNSDWNMSDENSGADLLGISATRYHIPHFVTDVLPLIYAMKLLSRQDVGKLRQTCEKEGGKQCTNRGDKELKGSLLVDERVADMKLTSWVPQVIGMLLNNQPRAHFDQSMFSPSPRVCFRSIIAFNKHRVIRQGRHWYGSHPMFSRHGLTRSPRQSTCPSLQLTIVNREGWVKRGGIVTGRDIVNIQQLLPLIEQQASSKGLHLSTKVVYFENQTLSQQISHMQNADIIIGTHGAGLGNLLFARMDTALLEVLPYGYLAGPFQELARALHITYSREIAHADIAGFYSCLQVVGHKWGGERVITKGEHMWKQGLKSGLQAHRIVDREYIPVKLCARSQRMRVHAERVAAEVVRLATLRCGRE